MSSTPEVNSVVAILHLCLTLCCCSKISAAGPSSSAAAGRLSPPPVDPAELAGGEFEVIHEDEDKRMIELLRAQV